MQGKVKENAEEVRKSAARAENTAWRLRLLWLAKETLWIGCGWLLGLAELAFGTRPLGVAVLCASGKHTLSILLGLVISALIGSSAPIVYISTYAVAAIVRVVTAMIFESEATKDDLSEQLMGRIKDAEEAQELPPKRETRLARLRRSLRQKGSEGNRRAIFAEAFLGIFTESVCLRMATGAVCSFIVSLYRIISGGFQYYDWFGAVFALAVTPAAIMVYSVILDKQVEHRILRVISRAALLFSLVWAANGISVAGVPVSVTLMLLFPLYLTATEGGAMGAAMAILCGVAYQPLYAPAPLLASLLFTLLKTGRRQGGVILASCLSPLFWAVYVGGAEVLISMLPACLLSGLLLTLALRFRGHEVRQAEAENGGELLRHRMEDHRHRDANDRFRGISDAFSSLSEMFYNLSDRFRRPGTLDLRRICDASFDAFCQGCPNRSVCWGLEYSETLGTVNGLISALHTKGKVTRAQIPSTLLHRCESTDAILEHMNRECAKLTGELLRNNRTEILAMDYEAAASIINDALEEDDGEYRFDAELEQKIGEYLADAGIRAHGVTVYGKRSRRIVVRGVEVEQANVTMETLRSDLGEMCGMELGTPTFEVEGRISTMTLQAKKKIGVIGAQNNVSADGGVSGDTVNLFSNKKDYFYALINDGMGAGKEAALTSNICSVFLEKMLRAGNRAGTSLRMLNNMIRSRGADSTRECSSTVDLLELDLMTAEASFIKSGAAPSFVVRAGVVHRLQAGTAPIGIIRTIDVQSTAFPLKVGDTVVMISDGILQNDPDAVWLTDYLSGASSLSPEEIVYHICLHAVERDEHDDCSAVALRIEAGD